MNMSLHVINSLFRCFPRAIMVQAMSTRFVPSCQVFNSIVSFHSIRKDFLTKPLLPSQCRHYAKGKDKKKDKLKGKVQINDVQIAEVTNVQALKDQMQETVEGLKDNFIKHLSLRSSSGAIEALKVDLDGKEHTIQELAQVVRKNPKTIVINMAIFPQAVPAVTKALRESGMNLNPQQDGTTLYVPVPKVTKEHRENLAKNAKTFFTKCKDQIRAVQIKHVKGLKKKEGVSVDVLRSVEQQIVAIADSYIAEAESVTKSKQTELVGDE